MVAFVSREQRHSAQDSTTAGPATPGRYLSARPLLRWGSSSSAEIKGLRRGKRIGIGSSGYVYKAKYHGLDVVVKFLHAEDAQLNDNQKERLEAEASSLREKQHPHLVRLVEYLSSHNCIIMEYCPNGSLYDLIHDPQKRSIVDDLHVRLRWLEEIAAAFVCLHHQEPRMIHRDLRTSNVFLDKHFGVKVGDFGLSSMVDLLDGSSQDTSRTNDRLALLYQAPEVLNADAHHQDGYSVKSDVYSFGILIQEILTLHNPYGVRLDPDAIREKMYAVKNGRIRPAITKDRTRLPGVWNQRLEPLVHMMNACCAHDPRDRPDFHDIYNQIKEIRAAYQGAVPPVKEDPFCQGPRIFQWTAGSLIVILVLCNAVIYLWDDTFDSDQSICTLSVFGYIVVIVVIAVAVIFVAREAREYYTKRAEILERLGNCRDLPCEEMELPTAHPEMDNEKKAARGPVVSAFQLVAEQSDHRYGPLLLTAMKYPCPRNWQQFCQDLLNELSEDTQDRHVTTIRGFCQKRMNDSKVKPEDWPLIVDYFLYCHEARQTSAWQKYLKSCNIQPDAVLSMPPGSCSVVLVK